MAGGIPLGFTQEDCFVIKDRTTNSFKHMLNIWWSFVSIRIAKVQNCVERITNFASVLQSSHMIYIMWAWDWKNMKTLAVYNKLDFSGLKLLEHLTVWWKITQFRLVDLLQKYLTFIINTGNQGHQVGGMPSLLTRNLSPKTKR